MAENKISKTIKGVYAGTCPDCNLMRGDWENKGTPCGRCGHKFATVAVAMTLDGTVKELDEKDTKTLSED